MSVNRHIQDAAQNVAKNAASTPSGSGGWIPSALKVGAVLLTAALSIAGGGDAAEAIDALNEIGKK